MSIKKILAVAGMVALTSSACVDLEVTNLNAPDRERALSTPGDVEALITGAYNTWWFSQHNWGPGPALSVGADQHTSSWGNFMMNDFGSEPRAAISNSASYGYAGVIESPYFNAYAALAAVRDGIMAIDGGLEIGDDGEDTQRAMAMGKFIQGIAMGGVALLYDKGAILNEDTDVENVTFAPYTELMAAAIAALQEGISLASAGSFTTEDSWLSGTETSATLVKLMHSYIARFTANVARTPAERAAVDWASVRSHVDQGITEDFTVYGDDVNWWDILKTYTIYGGWGRADIRSLGPSDQSGGFQAWMAMPVQQRNEFEIDTDDRRITGGDPQTDGKYFGYFGASPFRVNRGTYHFSLYGTIVYDDYGYDWIGEMVEVSVAEMDFLKAEAMYRANDKAGAVAIINSYRVPNGELPAVTVDGVSGARCTPRLASGDCAPLWETLKYEKRLEVWLVSAGDAFFDDRGWGDLVSGTAIQFPVPAAELETLLLDIYTFGGGGESSAPAEFLRPDFSADMISRKLQAMEAIQASHTRTLPNPIH